MHYVMLNRLGCESCAPASTVCNCLRTGRPSEVIVCSLQSDCLHVSLEGVFPQHAAELLSTQKAAVSIPTVYRYHLYQVLV